jgi:DNA polymerase I-like protein with 3'-5' exonuclease and polymerase domains
MVPTRWEDFRGVWSVDLEFAAMCGTGRPIPHVFVALDLDSGREIRLTGAELRRTGAPPFDVRRSGCLAYNFVAEAQCFEVLGWEQPRWPIDPYAEHLAMTNGLAARDVFEREEDGRRIGYRLVDALRFYGVEVSGEDEAHKHDMQLRAAQGEPFTAEEWRAITEYCAEDVRWLSRLFLAMREQIDLPAALVRGRYMTTIGQQMHRGIPVDRELVERFQAQRPRLRQMLIEETAAATQFYSTGQFSQALFFDWVEDQEIGWPCHADGSPVLERDTIKRIAELEQRVATFAELKAKLSKLEDLTIPIRADGRIRPNYMPLRTRTGRNKPRASEYPMLQAKWARGFVVAPPGRALAQLDFKAQEIYVAAALSEDRRLLEDLEDDPYLGFAIRSGFAPPGATKQTHGAVRELFKPALLGVVYGMGERTLAKRLGTDLATAREIRAQFKRHYRALWDWLEAVVLAAYATRYLESPLGWPLVVGPKLDSFTLRNHLIQATGGDILRAACLFAQDVGLGTIATLHDSILLEADADRIEAEAAELAVAMTRGADHVIGVPIPAEVEFIGRRYQLKGPHAELLEEVTRRLETPSRVG